MVVAIVVLVLITPLGAAIGIAVLAFAAQGGPGLALVTPIFKGLSGGSLIYVALFEVRFDIKSYILFINMFRF